MSTKRKMHVAARAVITSDQAIIVKIPGWPDTVLTEDELSRFFGESHFTKDTLYAGLIRAKKPNMSIHHSRNLADEMSAALRKARKAAKALA